MSSPRAGATAVRTKSNIRSNSASLIAELPSKQPTLPNHARQNASLLIRERTGEGRKRAQAAGLKFGRKPKLSDFQRKEALKRRAAGETLAEIARTYAVSALSKRAKSAPPAGF